MYGPGTILAEQYRIEAHLGQGGTGHVYLALDLRANQLVAIKHIRFDGTSAEMQAVALQTFQNEATVLSKMDHPCLPKVHRCFAIGQLPFLVMDYIKGRNLAAVVAAEEDPLPEDMVRTWAIELCAVLEYLHGHDPQIVFRDLKPANIILDVDGRIRLVDFGVSKLFEQAGPVYTKTFARGCGSPGFAAPEQYSGGTSTRTDIYSLGATLYALLAGTIPASAVERVGNVGALIPLSKVRPGLNPQFAEGIEKLMTIKAADRPRSIASVRSVLGLPSAVAATSAPAPTPAPAPAPAPPAPAPQSPAPSPRLTSAQASPPSPVVVTSAPAGEPYRPRNTSPTQREGAPRALQESQRSEPEAPLPNRAPQRPLNVPEPPRSPAPGPEALRPPQGLATQHATPSSSVDSHATLQWGGGRPTPAAHLPPLLSEQQPPSRLQSASQSRPLLSTLVGLLALCAGLLVWERLSPPGKSVSSEPPEPAPTMTRLTITTHPAGAVVTVNGKHQEGVTPVAAPLPSGGSYVVLIHLDGYLEVTKTLVLEQGETDLLDVPMTPLQPSPPPETGPTGRPSSIPSGKGHPGPAPTALQTLTPEVPTPLAH